MRPFLALALALTPGATPIGGNGVPASARVNPPSEKLAFAVRNDSVVEKTFALEHALVAQKVQYEGEESGQLSQNQLEVSSKFELEVADTFRKVDATRPLELRRLLKSAGLHVDLSFADPRGTKIADAWDADTPLKGKSVVYVWVPEEKGYGRHYDEIESLEEYLAHLSEDLDLRCLLPEGEVREGSEWTIDPSRLVDVFVPGGGIHIGFVKGGKGAFVQALSAGVAGSLYPVFGGTIKGNVTARWTETQEVDGARLARIALAVTVETDHDRTEAARDALPRDESELGRDIDHSSIRWKFQGTGTLVWNLGAGRFESLDLVGREDVTSDQATRVDTKVSRQLITMAGSLKVTARAAAKTAPVLKDK